jgi:hypothetical protein
VRKIKFLICKMINIWMKKWTSWGYSIFNTTILFWEDFGRHMVVEIDSFFMLRLCFEWIFDRSNTLSPKMFSSSCFLFKTCFPRENWLICLFFHLLIINQILDAYFFSSYLIFFKRIYKTIIFLYFFIDIEQSFN